MNKISFKLGVYFFTFVVLIETILFFYLYFGLVHTRIQEELSELRSRGNSHRDVLEKHYNQETIAHVALMESESDTDVVIADQNGKILRYSNELTKTMRRDIEKEKGVIPVNGKIIENRWKTEPVISTVSPIFIDKQLKGHVYMFKNTNSIHEMIANLKHHFLIVGGFSLIITIITVFLLSKFITIPLIRMKKATEKLSKGDFSVSLDIKSQDELGELARSIQRLSMDLQHLKLERNEFLASISHELRTPLTYIKGYSEIILKRNHLNEQESNVVIKVIDEGIGIPESDFPYIFDRLYRVDKSRSRESGGSGLGLAIAKEIIDAHRGTLEVKSHVGEGTQMIITIERLE